MAVGQWTRKFTWLMDMVEVKGRVRRNGAPSGTNLFEDAHAGIRSNNLDFFQILPDLNYAHLVDFLPGSNGLIKCETYPLVLDKADRINRQQPWSDAAKPDDAPFTIATPVTVPPEQLKVNDHVRVVGRWVIENGHPENQKPRGWLRVGDVFAEFHPFQWWDISRVMEPESFATVTETVSVAAPLYSSVYVGQGKHFANYLAGLASWWWETPQEQRVFLAADGSNFHPVVTAAAHIQAPPVVTGFASFGRRIQFEEEILLNNNSLPLAQTRSIAVVGDGIQVHVKVVAPKRGLREGLRADVNDPANMKSVFQARYHVKWRFFGSEISCINKPDRDSPNDRIRHVGGVLSDGHRWKMTLDEAILEVEAGHEFYVERPAGDRVKVVVGVGRNGSKHLHTVADFDEPNNLLSLPECPPAV